MLTRSLLLCAALLGLNACAHLKPLESPREQSLAPADPFFWRNVADNRRGDWYYLLNSGEDALAWRLHAIDSAATNIGKHFDAYWNNRWSVPIGRLVQPPLDAPGLAAHRSWLKVNAPRPRVSTPDQLQQKWLHINGEAVSGSQRFFSDRPAATQSPATI